MGRVALVLALVLCAVAVSAAAAAPGIPGRVLSYSAIGGPAQAGDRIAWFEPSGRGCGHLAVRDARTLRHHDLGARACPEQGVPIDFTYGAGTAFWVYDFCGNECYQGVAQLSPNARFAEAELEDLATDSVGIGTSIDDVAGDAQHLLYLQNTRDLDPRAPADACEDGNKCPVVITRSELEAVAGEGYHVLRPGVISIAVSGDAVALENESGVVEIRDLRTWRLQRRVAFETPGSVQLSPSYVAVVTAESVAVYRRSDGAPFFYGENESGYWDSEFSDAGFVFKTQHALVVERLDGRRLAIPLQAHGRLDIPIASLVGRRLAWLDGHTIRMLVLPR